jgi:hypothetical protein
MEVKKVQPKSIQDILDEKYGYVYGELSEEEKEEIEKTLQELLDKVELKDKKKLSKTL